VEFFSSEKKVMSSEEDLLLLEEERRISAKRQRGASSSDEEVMWERCGEEDLRRVLLDIYSEPFTNRKQGKHRRVHITTSTPVNMNTTPLEDDRFSEEEVQICRQRIYDHHCLVSKDNVGTERFQPRFPNSFAKHRMDRRVHTKINPRVGLVPRARNSSISPECVEKTLAHMMVELEILRNSSCKRESIPSSDIIKVGKQLMGEKRVTLNQQDNVITCDRVMLHWIRLLGTAKFFNVHNREQNPPGNPQLIERKWPLHPFFLWLYATRPLFNDPTKYAFSPEYGLYDAIQLHSFTVILASLCNVNEWYIDVNQMENALWKPHEQEGFDVYNHLHRFVDMFYHSNEVMVDAVVNHGLAAIVGRFLTMRAARYIRKTFFDLIRRWYFFYAPSGAYGDFIRQHRWVLIHFSVSLKENPHLLSPINQEYVDLQSFLPFAIRRHASAFRKLKLKDPSAPEPDGNVELFVVRFYKMIMDMFRLNPRLSLMGASSLSHDLIYLRDRRVSVVIPTDFYVERNFERYDLLGLRWTEDYKGPMPTPEEFREMRANIEDPSLVEIIVPPSEEEEEEKEEEEEEPLDLEVQRYLKRLEKEREMASSHPDVLTFSGKPVYQQHALLEEDGLINGGSISEEVVEQLLFQFQGLPETLSPEKEAQIERNLHSCMIGYLKMIVGQVPNLKVYKNDRLPQEYHEMYLRKFGVHQKRNRHSDDPNEIIFMDVTDMETIYNAMLTTPRQTFIRYLPGEQAVRVHIQLPDNELEDDDTCVDEDEERYRSMLPNASMRHAFFQNYTISLPQQWRRPVLRTMKKISSALSAECYHRIDKDNERATPFTDYTGRTEFLQRLVRQHKPDHERDDPEEYELQVASRTKRKRSDRVYHHTFQADRKCGLVNASNYHLAVGEDSGHVSDFRFDPRFTRLTGLGMLIALLEHEGSVRKLVTPEQVHMIPFVDLEDPANPSPCIDTVPYLTMPRVNLPVMVRWRKELNARYELETPSTVVGFYQSFYVFPGNGSFSTSGIFQMPPLPFDDTKELGDTDNK